MSKINSPSENYAGQMQAVEHFIAERANLTTSLISFQPNQTSPVESVNGVAPASFNTNLIIPKLWESQNGFDLPRQSRFDLNEKPHNLQFVAWQPPAEKDKSSNSNNVPPATKEQIEILESFAKGQKTAEQVVEAFGGLGKISPYYKSDSLVPKHLRMEVAKAAFKVLAKNVQQREEEEHKRRIEEFNLTQSQIGKIKQVMDEDRWDIDKFSHLEEMSKGFPELTDDARKYLVAQQSELSERNREAELEKLTSSRTASDALEGANHHAATWKYSEAEKKLFIDELAARINERFPRDANLLQAKAARERAVSDRSREYNGPRTFIELDLKHAEELIQKGYPGAAAYFLDETIKITTTLRDANKNSPATISLYNHHIANAEAQAKALRSKTSTEALENIKHLLATAEAAEKEADQLTAKGRTYEADALRKIATRSYLEAIRNEAGVHNLEVLETLGLANQPRDVSNLSTTEKFASAIEKSLKHLAPETAAKVKELFTPESIALMAGMAGVWAAGHFFGVSEVVDVLLLGAGAVMLGKEAVDVGKHLAEFALGAYNAKTEKDLEAAGQHFATAITKVGVDIVAAVLTHKATSSVAPKVKAGLQQARGKYLGLTESEQALLGKLTDPKTKGSIRIPEQVSPQTLARLTNATQSEIAVLRNSQTGETMLIKGNRQTIPLTVEEAKKLAAEGWRFEAHSHWRGTNPSVGDARVLGEGFNQRHSLIVDRKARMAQFTPEQGYGGAVDRLSQGAATPKPVNLTSLGRGRWLGKAIKDGDKLPDGYEWNNGNIHRKNGFAEKGYAKLCVDENGRIAVTTAPERISNPYQMKKNHEDALTAQFMKEKGLSEAKARAAAQKRMADIESHHLLPDEAIQRTELGKEARKHGYDLDKAANLLDMPDKAPKGRRTELGHWTSHPKYTEMVVNTMSKAAADLIKDHKVKELKDVPAAAILKKMSELENFFRSEIEKVKRGEPSVVPHNGDRLIFDFQNRRNWISV